RGARGAARPEQLSAGQRERGAIARPLAMGPEAILFDEPTSALDPRMAGEVLRVIADLAGSGQTMVVVTHAMGFARRVAHTVHVMHAGRVAESGPPEQVFENPTHPETRVFLAEAEKGKGKSRYHRIRDRPGALAPGRFLSASVPFWAGPSGHAQLAALALHRRGQPGPPPQPPPR